MRTLIIIIIMVIMKTMKHSIIGQIFQIFSILFVTFLIATVVYETIITEELPTDNEKVLEKISDKYSIMPKVFGDSFGLDENEQFEDEKEYYDKGWKD